MNQENTLRARDDFDDLRAERDMPTHYRNEPNRHAGLWKQIAIGIVVGYSVLGIISVGFLAFLIFTSNPFWRLQVPPMDGQDLNPLLQDPGLIFHPPLLPTRLQPGKFRRINLPVIARVN